MTSDVSDTQEINPLIIPIHEIPSDNSGRLNSMLLRKPKWIRKKKVDSAEFYETRRIMRDNNLSTVCEEASCPNIGECWSKRHATMMIMGEICTRGCAFCDVNTGKPSALDSAEPARVALAVQKLGLHHVVITSVDRDDLDDGGAEHIGETIRKIRSRNPHTTIEVLTPDFRNKGDAADAVFKASPDVFNHNIETVPRLYRSVRPGARYYNSIRLLNRAKEANQKLFTKSGIMVGLGETMEEIRQVMDDLRVAEVDFLTIGQYLQPSTKHYPIERYWHPEEFEALKNMAYGKGFLVVSASPLTRSSYHASEDFAKLKQARERMLTRKL